MLPGAEHDGDRGGCYRDPDLGLGTWGRSHRRPRVFGLQKISSLIERGLERSNFMYVMPHQRRMVKRSWLSGLGATVSPVMTQEQTNIRNKLAANWPSYQNVNWPGATAPTDQATLDLYKAGAFLSLANVPVELLALLGLTTSDDPPSNIARVNMVLDEWFRAYGIHNPGLQAFKSFTPAVIAMAAKPPVQPPPVVAPAPSGFPSWGYYAIGGVALLGVGFLAFRIMHHASPAGA